LYTTQHRNLSYERFSGTTFLSGVHRTYDFEVPQLVEGVYSWRTGRNSVSDPPLSPRSPKTDGFGIAVPSNRGSLVDRLAERKRYTDEVMRAAFPAETATGSVSTSRTSTTDSGHLFTVHKTVRVPYRGTLNYAHSNGNTSSGDCWGSVWTNSILNPSPHKFGFPGETSALYLQVSDANRQGMANRYFAQTAPDRNEASLAVTIIELLRGDIPSVLKNFREMMAGMRSIKNLLGSDYLNITFGWTPLIVEYANLIKVGMNLDRAIYYESFRRKRQWDGPSVSGRRDGTVMISNLNTPYLSASMIKPGGTPGISSGAGTNWVQDAGYVESENYHWASRYTGLAKPTRRANDFNDQAADVLKRLGLVDDPQMIWDLTPYSWLVDWFTTMGDSISNANVYSPIKGKYTVDYAYLTTQRTFSVEGSLIRRQFSDPTLSFDIARSRSFYSNVTRWRSRATPFGFGTQLGSLNATQYAILVALGLARSR